MSALTPGTFDVVTATLTLKDGRKIDLHGGTLSITADTGAWRARFRTKESSTAVAADGVAHVHLVGDVYAWSGDASRITSEGKELELSGSEPLSETPAATG